MSTIATKAQVAALRSAPITLTGDGHLPIGSPNGGTLKVCRSRGWLVLDGNRIVLTDAGARLLEHEESA